MLRKSTKNGNRDDKGMQKAVLWDQAKKDGVSIYAEEQKIVQCVVSIPT